MSDIHRHKKAFRAKDVIKNMFIMQKCRIQNRKHKKNSEVIGLTTVCGAGLQDLHLLLFSQILLSHSYSALDMKG